MQYAQVTITNLIGLPSFFSHSFDNGSEKGGGGWRRSAEKSAA